MKILDIEPYIILDVYIKEKELTVPAWHSDLTTESRKTLNQTIPFFSKDHLALTKANGVLNF